MSGHRRAALLDDAEILAAWLRRNGYPEAEVAAQYCVEGLESDGFYTKTVSVYAGPKTTGAPK